MQTAIKCLALLARRHGVDTSPERLMHDYAVTEEPSERRVLRIAQDLGLKGDLRKVGWRDLNKVGGAFPVLCPLANRNWVIIAGVDTGGETPVAQVVDPLAETAEVIEIDQMALENAWTGQIILLKKAQDPAKADQPFGFKWFLPEVMRHKMVFAEVCFVALLMHVFALSVPIFFQITFDKVVGNQSLDTLYVLTTAVVAAVTFNAVIEYLRGLLLLHATSKIDIRIATRTFGKLLSLPIDFFRVASAGALTKHMQQSSAIREFLTGRLFLTLLDCLALVVYLPILALYSPLLTVIVLAFAAVIAAITLMIKGSYRDRLTALYKAEGERQSMLVETISGMETVKALAIEPVKRLEWDNRASRAVSLHVGVGRLSYLVNGLSKYLGTLMTVTILFIGVQLIFEGQLSIGAIIAFSMLSQRVSGPLIAVAGLVNEFQQAALSMKMLGKVMDQKPEQRKTGGLTPDIKGRIEFDDVCFKYPKAPAPALDCLSFSIEAGQSLGIVGRSGSGKSTITRLLQGFYEPQGGLVRIDGMDMRELDLAHLRMATGIVLQESFLFKGTVKENIAATQPAASFFEVVAASRLAGADEFIQKLPQGYDTLLEEGATNLSGGQKQRLAIARALLKRPRILILDEATSALDPESEVIVQANMARIAKGRTVIAISHRLSSLIGADTILVLDQGRIAGVGSHGDLMASCDLYRHLWAQQNANLRIEAAE